MSKASDFAEQMRVAKESQRPELPDGSVHVSDEGDLVFYVGRKSAADVPELVRWLVDTFDVPCSAAWTIGDKDILTAEIDLLRKKLKLANMLGELERQPSLFDGAIFIATLEDRDPPAWPESAMIQMDPWDTSPRTGFRSG